MEYFEGGRLWSDVVVFSELMLLGFISLSLTVFQQRIASLCMPARLRNFMLPCKYIPPVETSPTGSPAARRLLDSTTTVTCPTVNYTSSWTNPHQFHISSITQKITHTVLNSKLENMCEDLCHLSRQRFASRESSSISHVKIFMPHLTWYACAFHNHSAPNLFTWKYISVSVGLHCHLSCGIPLFSENPRLFRIPGVPRLT